MTIPGYRMDFDAPQKNGIADYLIRTGKRGAVNPFSGNVVVNHRGRVFELVREKKQAGSGPAPVVLANVWVMDSGRADIQTFLPAGTFSSGFVPVGDYTLTGTVYNMAVTADAIFAMAGAALRFDLDGGEAGISYDFGGELQAYILGDGSYAYIITSAVDTKIYKYAYDLSGSAGTYNTLNDADKRMDWWMDAEYFYILESDGQILSRYSAVDGVYADSINLGFFGEKVCADDKFIYVSIYADVHVFSKTDLTYSGIIECDGYINDIDAASGLLYVAHQSKIAMYRQDFTHYADFGSYGSGDGQFQNIAAISVRPV